MFLAIISKHLHTGQGGPGYTAAVQSRAAPAAVAETLGNASAKRAAEVEGTWLLLVALFQVPCDCQGKQVVPYSGYLAGRSSGAKIQAVLSL